MNGRRQRRLVADLLVKTCDVRRQLIDPFQVISPDVAQTRGPRGVDDSTVVVRREVLPTAVGGALEGIELHVQWNDLVVRIGEPQRLMDFEPMLSA